MQDKAIAQLKQIGLNETEAKIYLFGIKYPSVGVAEIQKQTGIKRPTIYHNLDTLTLKGLVAKSSGGEKLNFSFAPPQQLSHLAEEQIREARQKLNLTEEIIPVLEDRKYQGGGTIVAHYEGVEGVKTVIDIALYCKSRSWDILAPKVNFLYEFDDQFAQYYLATRKRRRVKSRSLWEKPARRDLTPDEMREREPRLIPEVMQGKFKSMIIIFDDKVALITSLKELSAILITSDELNSFFKILFEGLWAASKPYKSID